ncbi:MAG TPA: TraB/GumN family protein, partial [Candidatus Kapabacteria bacterium]|nr:TraB/GumN family protein [Candidatus Kapabacteria bacterium]
MNIVHFTRSTLIWLACLYALLLAPLASASLLWQIEKEGKQNHIFGTIHVADRDIVKLPAHVDRVVSQADVLLLEVKQGAQSQQVIADRTTLQEST